MDMNQFSGSGLPYAGFLEPGLLPVGSEAAARQRYADLTETQKEHLLLKCKDAKTAQAMDRVVDSVLSDTDARAVAQEEAEEKDVNTSPRLW